MQPPKDPGKDPDVIDTVGPFAFQDYLKDGVVDWTKKHTCVRLATGHGQLWDLFNGTRQLHNFHIHQMKFRIARRGELLEHGIDPDLAARAFWNAQLASLRDEDTSDVTTWHDTIPIPPLEHVRIVLSFDDEEQLGKFV